ncbi:hypothetical protein DSLASN_11230 [Desulfoluna limicola]|uniref:Ankyrin n=1 Tax=Desulfoluna limicola TaxID=2810562 RepID=A0ABM7PEJ9_9BACT|nr:hypothetical protein [Desulfoluna limicola]BCS95491.1 hypothetical protein DSLASN_11230 [Desulfoluna limicola]
MTKKEILPYDRMMTGILQGDEEKILAAIKGGADVNQPFHGHAPITFSVQSGKVAIFDLLLEEGAELSPLSARAIWVNARRKGNNEFIARIKDRGVRIGFAARLAFWLIRIKDRFLPAR